MENTNKFIPILSDYGFKLVFGNENQTLFLRKALDALVQNETPIKNVKFIRNEFKGITPDSRGGLYDLICEDEHGNNFIVEMQLGHYKNFIHRSKFYAFQRFNTLVEKGKYKFKGLKKIYCIGFLANNIYPKSALYYHYGTLKNQIGENLDDQITHIIIEIRKFEKKATEIQSDLDKLLFLMKNLDAFKEQMKQLPPFLSEKWMKQAIQKLDRSKMNAEQRMHFEMMLAQQASILEMTEQEKEHAIKKVKQEIDQMIEEKDQVIETKDQMIEEKDQVIETKDQVIEEKDQMIEEKNKAIEDKNKVIAKKMKIKKIAIETIAEITGLSPEIIEAL